MISLEAIARRLPKKLLPIARQLYVTMRFYRKPGLPYQGYPTTDRAFGNDLCGLLLRLLPAAHRGIRGLWQDHDALRSKEDADAIRTLLERARDMLSAIHGGRRFHFTMSRDEELKSLTLLTLTLSLKAGRWCASRGDFDSALAAYDNALCPPETCLADCEAMREEVRADIRSAMARKRREITYDVLLITAPGLGNPRIMPWNLMVLGTKLAREGLKVRLVDAWGDANTNVLEQAAYARLVGFSVMTSQIRTSLELSRQIKNLYPEKPIIWGGVHPTLFPQQCLQEDAIDFVACGDGEELLTALCRRLNDADPRFDDIAGLGFKKDGSPILNPMGPPPRFEEAGPWNFELFDMRHYMNWQLMYAGFRYPSVSLLATRGCPRGCTFCINSIVQHTRVHRAKPVECVLDDIAHLIDRYGVRTINFTDDAFFVKPAYFSSIIEGILKRGLKFEWGASAHIADILRHRELLLHAKKAGLIWVSGSGESGSNRLLQLIKKGITVEDTLECMNFCADNDLMISSNFITHLPTETSQETQATLKLVQDIRDLFSRKNNPSNIMGPFPYRPYPGSVLFDMCVKSGFTPPQKLDEWASKIMPDGHFLLDNITWLG